MPCSRNLVFQALTKLYTNLLVQTYGSMVNVSRSLSDNIAGQAPEATPTARLLEEHSRIIYTKANVYGIMEVDATLECRMAANVDQPGLPQDKINELEAALDTMFDPPIVISDVGQVIVMPRGDRTSNPGSSEAILEYPITVRFDRVPGSLEVVNA